MVGDSFAMMIGLMAYIIIHVSRTCVSFPTWRFAISPPHSYIGDPAAAEPLGTVTSVASAAVMLHITVGFLTIAANRTR